MVSSQSASSWRHTPSATGVVPALRWPVSVTANPFPSASTETTQRRRVTVSPSNANSTGIVRSCKSCAMAVSFGESRVLPCAVKRQLSFCHVTPFSSIFKMGITAPAAHSYRCGAHAAVSSAACKSAPGSVSGAASVSSGSAPLPGRPSGRVSSVSAPLPAARNTRADRRLTGSVCRNSSSSRASVCDAVSSKRRYSHSR